MIEFYKYLYAGLRPPPLQISKIYPRNSKAKQMCSVVQLTSHLYTASLSSDHTHMGVAMISLIIFANDWEFFELVRVSTYNIARHVKELINALQTIYENFR